MRNDKRLAQLEKQRPPGKVIVIDCRGKTPAEIEQELADADDSDIIIRIVDLVE